MTGRLNLYKFNEIYDETNDYLLKYVIIKCHNINDVNDIIQETYLELWNILNKKELSDLNVKSYLIGIANNKIKNTIKCCIPALIFSWLVLFLGVFILNYYVIRF